MMLALSRWVAAVPFLEDAAFRRRRADVWCGNAEALELGGCDHEEHAHLLAGLFLEAGRRAYVVLGTALQGAAAAFVLTSRLRLWNPLTGSCVPVRDPACELREVGTVYDSSNVWANVQASGHPWDMGWDLSDGAAWRPFFGGALPPRELASMQVPPTFADLDRLVYEELEARLEETVRAALYEARSVVITQPNNRLSRVLKALLRELPAQLAAIDAAALEASCALAEGGGLPEGAGGGEAADYAAAKLRERTRLLRSLQAAHNARVSREMRGCVINGQVLALPFSDNWAAAAAEAVLNTGLHRTTDPRVKFAMAAFVEPMGAAWVCRMWVYAAAVRDAT